MLDLFAVEILFWEDLCLELANDPRLLVKHFPGWSRLSDHDREPILDFHWMVAGSPSNEVSIAVASGDLVDLKTALDPYDGEEMEYLASFHPGDAAKAFAYNHTVEGLLADPSYQRAWRASRLDESMSQGMNLGVAVSGTNAVASSLVAHLELDSCFDLFRADETPRPDRGFRFPEHPPLDSERSYSTELFMGMGRVIGPVAAIAEAMSARLLNVRVDRSLRVDGPRVAIRVDRLPPRRSAMFIDDVDGIVITPRCRPGRYVCRWRADAENLSAPQEGELHIVVTPSRAASFRRRYSHIGPALQARRVSPPSDET